MAGAEGLEPSARGFGAAIGSSYLFLPIVFCKYVLISGLPHLLSITK